LENLGRALAAAGAGPADVTMLRVYIVGFNRDVAAQVAPRVANFFAGVEPTASTWVGVQALMHPDFLVEIEAVAAVPPEPRDTRA
jgi:2-iminobutanoate/2-iminopropanoate deaminase